MSRPLRIYLADLVHTTGKATNYTLPLNIGWVAAYLKQQHGAGVDVRLFKNPRTLLETIRDTPPAILGLSNYMWNYELNRFVASKAKAVDASMLLVSGGPNIQHTPAGHTRFLNDQTDIDIYLKFEGERAFDEIVQRYLDDPGRMRAAPLTGSAFLAEDQLVDGGDFPTNGRELHYPSPYLSGLLDEFLEESLIPIFETNRGCPFKCTFCAWGVAALDRVTRFPLDRVKEELRYVHQKSPNLPLWIFADANFGMLARDVEIASEIKAIADQSPRLSQVLIWWAKNSGERTKEIARILGPLSVPYVAMQSLDPEVLENIKRDNISVPKLLDLMHYYHDRGLKVTTDILLGLPGETRDSHYTSLRSSLDFGFDSIKGANLILLPGTEAEEAECREEFEIKSMFRLREGSYDMYEGEPVLEYEEIVTETSTMKREDFLEFRMVHWLVMLLWNTGLARPILRFARAKGLNPIDVIKLFYEHQGQGFPAIEQLIESFWHDARTEFFPTLDDAKAHFSRLENYEDLKQRGFSKLNFKYTARFLLDDNLTSELFDYLAHIVSGAAGLTHPERSLLTELAAVCRHRIFFVNTDGAQPSITISAATSSYLADAWQDPDAAIEVDVETGHYVAQTQSGEAAIGPSALQDDGGAAARHEVRFLPNDKEEQAIRTHLERLGYAEDPLKAMEKALEFMRMMSFVRTHEVVN